MKSSLGFVLLVAAGIVVADVSELSRKYLPPAAVNNGFAEYSVTDVSVAESDVTTTPAGTTVVEIEQVPLEEMHFKEEEQSEPTQMTEQPLFSSAYEQAPALVYEAPIYEAQTEIPATAVEEVTLVEELPVVEEEKPPAVENVDLMEEGPKYEERESSMGMDAVLSEPSIDDESGSAVKPAEVSVAEETPVVNEAPEVPIAEAEPEPAHVLAKDGYRYKTGNHFHYRF